MCVQSYARSTVNHQLKTNNPKITRMYEDLLSIRDEMDHSELNPQKYKDLLTKLNHFYSQESNKELNKKYPQEIVTMLTNTFPRSKVVITVTMTTCKRFDLFCATVNSLLNTMEDIHLIDEWIVVDDNSSEEDRKNMKELYPFINFIWKTYEQKGHGRSMNLLINQIRRNKSKYVLHIEDDWLFLEKGSYLKHMISILESNANIGQVLFNQNYMELISEIFIAGGQFSQIHDPLLSKPFNFAIHEYLKTDAEKQTWMDNWGMSRSSTYWPHFSLRPGLWSTERVFDNFSEWFDTTSSHFEMEFAQRYEKRGMKTAFLIGPHCEHIGKHTSDRYGINAYTMNDEVQFLPTNQSRLSNQLDHRVWFLVLNLTRRPDRMEQFYKETQYFSPIIYRYEAVDGKEYRLTPKDYLLFAENDYSYRAGIVGCALSHINIWQKWISPQRESDQRKWMCVFEDDINVVCPSEFETQLLTIIDKADQVDVDLLYIGYSKIGGDGTQHELGIEIINESNVLQMMGGTFAYMITKQGARKLLTYIQQNGMQNAIDTMMIRAMKDGAVCGARVNPYNAIIYSELGYDKNSDSDIQQDYTSLTQQHDQTLFTKHVHDVLEQERALLKTMECTTVQILNSTQYNPEYGSMFAYVYPMVLPLGNTYYVCIPHESLNPEYLEFIKATRPTCIQLV